MTPRYEKVGRELLNQESKDSKLSEESLNSGLN